MARENLFLPAAVPEKSIMRMRGEIDPQIAAQEYEDQLNAIAIESGEPIYQHDLILLGLGDDGHTASLFPGTAALDEMTRRVVANFVPKLNAWRLTFTFPLINHARHILFLVGASKNPQLIERVLAGDRQFPAARVNPVRAGEVTWIIGERSSATLTCHDRAHDHRHRFCGIDWIGNREAFRERRRASLGSITTCAQNFLAPKLLRKKRATT